jgi:hypothetical protein
LTPTAISAWTLMIRPPSRTFWVSASTQTKGIGAGVQWTVAERGYLRVQMSGHRADLGLRQLRDAK